MRVKDLMVLLKKEKRHKLTVGQKVAVGIGALTAVGITIIILFVPKLGKKAREKIKKKTEEIKKSIKSSGYDITKEINKTTKNISNEIKKII